SHLCCSSRDLRTRAKPDRNWPTASSGSGNEKPSFSSPAHPLPSTRLGWRNDRPPVVGTRGLEGHARLDHWSTRSICAAVGHMKKNERPGTPRELWAQLTQICPAFAEDFTA